MVQYVLWRKEGERFVDDNNELLNAGVFTFFDAGGSTPRTVYKNATGATPWGTSVTLGSAGQLTDDIYVAEGAFKEVLKTAGGATIFEHDNIPGATPVTPLDAARPLTPIEADASSVVTMTEAMLGTVQELDCTGGNISFVLLDPADVDSGEWVVVKHKGSANQITITGTVDGASNATLDTPNDSTILISNGTDSWERIGSHRDNAAATHRANTFTVQQIDALASSAAVPRIIRATHDDANAGPLFPLERISASPAASDLLGRIPLRGRDDAGNLTDYAALFARIIDAANGSEDGELVLEAMIAAVSTEILKIGNGLQIGSPTGGYKGAGTLNATEIYKNGVAGWTHVPKTADESKSANTTLANDTHLLFAMLANTKYSVRGRIFFSDSDDSDIKFRHTGPASPTVLHLARYARTAANDDLTNEGNDTGYSGSDIAITGTWTEGIFAIDGIIHNGANAGNFAIQWAQNTSKAGALTVRAGSYLEYRIVA